MLTIQNLEAGYGHIAALKGVDVTVGAGEFVAILGPNGAGKSTLMKAIIGVLRQQAGAILFADQRIDDLATAQRIRLGMGIIPEGRQLFFDMTVRENLDSRRLCAARRAHRARDRHRAWNRCLRCFRASPSARRNSPGASRAARPRWSRSAAR